MYHVSMVALLERGNVSSLVIKDKDVPKILKKASKRNVQAIVITEEGFRSRLFEMVGSYLNCIILNSSLNPTDVRHIFEIASTRPQTQPPEQNQGYGTLTLSLDEDVDGEDAMFFIKNKLFDSIREALVYYVNHTEEQSKKLIDELV